MGRRHRLGIVQANRPVIRATGGIGGGSEITTLNNDPYFSSVVLLAFNNNAADTTTTFVDQSNLALTLTAVGDAQYDTAQAPTGMLSSYLSDGTGDAIRLPVSTGLTLSGNFTIEAFVRLNANDSNTFLLGPDTTIRNVQCRMNEAGIGMLSMYDGLNNPRSTSNGSSWSNVWRHTAYSRIGSDLTFWQDGIQVGTAVTNSGTFNFSGQYIGAAGGATPTTSLTGWLCSLRVTKGVGRYTVNFTPPTLPLPIV